ncbi:hypothetical protein BaRGS_00038869, partial [Batillaria attramentaria]
PGWCQSYLIRCFRPLEPSKCVPGQECETDADCGGAQPRGGPPANSKKGRCPPTFFPFFCPLVVQGNCVRDSDCRG